MKMAGCNTEEEFYQKYPSEKAFFAAYPHMKGNQTMKNGGAASGHSGSYWNGESWVSTAGDSGTYSNGVYYANGGPTFPIGGSAPIFGRGGVASFNISNNEYPTPFAMAPGSGMGTGYLQDLPTHMAHGGHIPGAEIVDPFAMYPGTGKGGGMLQDLPTEMKRGGKHKKHHDKKLTPQQMQMMMQAMAMAQQPQGMPMPPQGGGQPMMMSPEEQQMMAMQQGQQPMPGMMKSGGIHIDPSKRGTFTAAATKHGKSVQAFASQVLANKENYSPAMVKKANFARNASKWHHEYGGMYEDGGSTMPDNPGFRALPAAVQQKIMDNMQTGGMVTGDRMVYGPGGQYMQNGGQANPYANMAMGQIGQMQQKIGQLGKMVNQGTELEPWVASKMTLANDYLNSVENYLEHNPEAQEAVMRMGGMINPYHPMAKFMRGGYYQTGGPSYKIGEYVEGKGYWDGATFVPTPPGVTSDQISPNGSQAVNFNAPNSTPGDAFKSNSIYDNTVYDPSTDPNNPVNNPSTMPQQGRYAASQNAAYEGNMDQTPEESKGPTGLDKARNWGNAILGTGMTALGVAGALADRRDARNLRNKQFNDRSSANMYAAVNQPGGKGDYTQQGVFRPDSMTPTAAGKFYPGMSGSYNQGMGITAKMGGVMNNYTYAHGGYHAGQELELSDAEIANLKRMGYQFDIL